jgi:aminopeptidase N
MLRLPLGAVGALILLLASSAAPASAQSPSPGEQRGHDALFPEIGNGGYDAQGYALDLRYRVRTQQLAGTATMTATATQDLSSFSLDLEHLRATAVTVDGAPAAFFDQPARAKKLVVTPAAPLATGATFSVAVTYGGRPRPVIDPDGSREGWISDPRFGASVVSEPIGARGWFPVNDVLDDKATFAITLRTPAGWQVVGTGDATARSTAGGWTTTRLVENHPIAPYLASVSIGHFDQRGSRPDDPTRPFVLAVDRTLVHRRAITRRLARTPAMLNFLARYYGVPYPFHSAGGVVPRVDVGYALETATKPTYALAPKPTSTGPDAGTIAHENAHQWFGNSVTPSQWRDVWLSEGNAELSSWLWLERHGDGIPARELFARRYAMFAPAKAVRDFYAVPTANPPQAANLFDFNAMYVRGAMVLEAIREIVGDSRFRTIQRTWLTEHAYANASTADYIALVKRLTPDLSASRWDAFFDQWLYRSYPGVPSRRNRPQINPGNFRRYAGAAPVAAPAAPAPAARSLPNARRSASRSPITRGHIRLAR